MGIIDDFSLMNVQIQQMNFALSTQNDLLNDRRFFSKTVPESFNESITEEMFRRTSR